jgi:MFS family permease
MTLKVEDSSKSAGCRKTRLALLWMNLTSEPLIALYTLLPFILRKDLGASTLQLSIFITLRPVLSVFSFYWSAYLTNRKNTLLSNLMGAWLLARLPFLLLPWVNNVWFLLFAAGVYQLFSKAGTPALIEILKVNIPKKPREHIFSFYYVLSFVESVVLGLTIGDILDGSGSNWRLLFFISSLIGLSSIFVQMRIPIQKKEDASHERPSLNKLFIEPWKNCFRLIKSRPDFAHFQWGFMIGGFELMLIAPALSIFYADVLSVSHANIAVARFILMGIGVVCSSVFWRKGIGGISLPKLICFVLVGFVMFPLVLLFAQTNVVFFYLAFLLYGVAQAGSHLIWNLSGTLFAPEEDSFQFSNVNILMVGLRGAVGPLLGGVLCSLFGATTVLALGVGIAFYGAWYMLAKNPAKLPKKAVIET